MDWMFKRCEVRNYKNTLAIYTEISIDGGKTFYKSKHLIPHSFNNAINKMQAVKFGNLSYSKKELKQ